MNTNQANPIRNKNLKKFVADSYYDGRFGTYYGEQASEPRIVWARGPKAAFEKAFGFSPSGRIEMGAGYRQVNSEGLSLSAECFRIQAVKLTLEEVTERYAEEN